jgi:hypothetical protein
MNKNVRKILSLVLLTAFFMTAFSTPVIAEPSKDHARSNATAGAIVGDLILIRPVLVSLTILGSCCFVATLPFTLIGRNTTHAAKKLVVEPAQYTFTYPLGSF